MFQGTCRGCRIVLPKAQPAIECLSGHWTTAAVCVLHAANDVSSPCRRGEERGRKKKSP